MSMDYSNKGLVLKERWYTKAATSISFKKILLTTCFFLLVNVSWANWSFRELIRKQATALSVTAPSVEVCEGQATTVNLDPIVIDEDGQTGDFKETSPAKTLVFSFGAGITLDGSTLNANLTNSGANASVNATVENGNLKIEYEFNNTSLSEGNTLTISGLKVVVATSVTSGNYNLVVSSGTEADLSLNTSSQPLATVTVNAPPAVPSKIYGPASLFKGETAVFSVPAVAGATEYEWTIPGDFTVMGNADKAFIVLQADKEVSPTTISVKAKNSSGCVSTAKSRDVSIIGKGLVVSNKATDICNNGSAITLPDIVLTEKFYADFASGSGNLILEFDNNTNFEFTGGTPEAIFTTASGQGTLKVEKTASQLKIKSYDFTTSQAELNTLTIRGIQVKSTSAIGTTGIIKMQNNADFVGIDGSTVFASLTTIASADASTISFTNPANVVCTNNTTTVFTITDTGNSGATYEWELPVGITGTPAANTKSITLTIGNAAQDGDIKVRAINTAGCVSAWVTHPVTVSTTPQKPADIVGSDQICVGSTNLYYVPAVAGVSSYEWVVPTGKLTSLTETVTTGATEDVITTTTNFVNLTSIDASATPLDIKVIGVSSAGCSNGQYSNLKSITINSAEDINIEGVAEGQTFTTEDTPVNLVARLASDNSLVGGTFEGPGVSGGKFSPSTVSIPSGSTSERVVITYTYQTAPEDCPFITRINVTVSKSSGIPNISASYCQGKPVVQDFSIDRLLINDATNKYYRYIVGLKPMQGITAKTASDALPPIQPGCTVDLTQVPSNTAKYNYTFTPGSLTPGVYRIQAYVVTVFNKLNVLDPIDRFGTPDDLTKTTTKIISPIDLNKPIPTCNVALQTLATITINELPAPVIRTPAGSSFCADNTTEYTYSVVPQPGHTYSWDAGTDGRIVSSNGDVITVAWKKSGSQQIKVIATNGSTGCQGEDIVFVDVKPIPTPSITGRVDGKDKTQACAYATVTYRGDTGGGNTYDWSVTNGSILPRAATGQAADEVRVAWLNQPGTLTLNTTNANGCQASTDLSVAINTASDPNIKGPTAVCAFAKGIVYTIDAPAPGDVIQWLVDGVDVTDPSDYSQITVDWGEGPLGSVSVKKTSSGCVGIEELNVAINALPVAELIPSSTVYCITESEASFQPTVNGDPTLPVGTGVYTLENTSGTVINTAVFNGDKLDISSVGIGKYVVKYTFTITAGGCQDVSSGTPIEIIAKPDAQFSFKDGKRNYCVNEEMVLNASLQGGEYTITKLDINPVGTPKVFAASAATTTTQLPLSGLDGEGNYQIIYTFRNSSGCEDTSNPRTFRVHPLPTVTIDENGVDDNYCIEEDAFTLFVKIEGVSQSAALNLGASFFEIRRISGTRTTTDFEVMKEVKSWGVSLSRRFNPKRPLYSEAEIASNAPTTEWNELTGVYEIRYTYTNSNNCQVTSAPIKITLDKLPVIAFTGLSNFYCKAVTSATVTPSVDGVPPSATNQGLFRIYKDGVELTSFSGTTFNPAGLNKLGDFTMTYEYQNGDGCKEVTAEQTFKIGEAIVPKFRFDSPTTDNKYCIKGNDITLTPNAANKGGTFTITTPKGDVVPLSGNVIEMATLPETGLYYVTYTFSDSFGCTGTSVPQAFQIVPLPAISIKGISSSGEYCVQSTTPVTLVPEIRVEGSLLQNVPDLNPTNAYFEIKRISGPKGVTNYEQMVTPGSNTLTNKFNPSQPLPNSLPINENAPTSEWNKIVGEYAIRYVFEDNNGCKKTSSPEIIKVTRLPELSFTGLNASYCDDVDLVTLTPFDGESKISAGIVFKYKNLSVPGSSYIPFSQGFSFSPKKLIPGEYEIVLESTAAGCSNSSSRDGKVTVTIEPTPKNIKIVASRDYNSQLINFSATADGVNASWNWSWDFKDGTTNQEQNPNKLLNSVDPQVINYEVIPSTELGCNAMVSKRFKIDFDFTGHCEGGVTQFTNLSELPGDVIGSVSWDFGDGQGTSTELSPGYTYQTPGTYWVTLSVNSQDGVATYKLRRRLDIFPVVTVNTDQFYVEGFESGTAGWISHGVVDVDRVGVDSTSWTLKKPNGFVINNPDGNAWVTDNRSNPNRNNTDANYNSNEQSYVESPCFDIAGLNKPMISFSYWSDTDLGGDGVSLLYTVDDGKTWSRLGTENLGINWYNTKPILGAPGSGSSTVDVNSNPDSQGWSGKIEPTNGTWKVARYSLTEILIKMEQMGITNRMVRFRMAFGSNADNTPNAQFDGFTFDNVIISNRNRLVLLEYFINTGVENAAQHDLEAKNFPQTGNKNEIVKIHHHTAFPAVDSFNEANPKDPSARAFHHGIREVPRGIIDGYFRDELIGQWTQDIFADRTLIPSPFRIDVTNASTSGGQLNVSTEIKALLAFDRKVIINVVVVDSAANDGEHTFYNVTRKMLPDAAGTYRDTPWTLGESQTLNLSWDYGNLDPSKFKIVVFIEDYETKEIWQAGTGSVSTQRKQEGQSQQQVTSVEDELLMEGAVVYPNPTTNRLNVAIKAPLSPKAQWQILSVTGRLVKQGTWTQGKRRITIDVKDLTGGLYILRVTDKGKTSHLRFKKL